MCIIQRRRHGLNGSKCDVNMYGWRERGRANKIYVRITSNKERRHQIKRQHRCSQSIIIPYVPFTRRRELFPISVTQGMSELHPIKREDIKSKDNIGAANPSSSHMFHIQEDESYSRSPSHKVRQNYIE